MAEPHAAFVRRRLLTGSAGLVLVLIAPGCKSKEPASCTSTSGLSPEAARVRQTLNYSDRSTDPARICEACVQWVAAKEIGECGSCKVMQGPIHPKGTCNVFAPSS